MTPGKSWAYRGNLIIPALFPAIMRYKFIKPLIEGTIKSRPNRFIFMVDINGSLEKCHCPSTGRIGDIKFDNVPCLLSENSPDRITKYTVEAISSDRKNWIGINQNKANHYIEFFLKTRQLSKIAAGNVERERTLGYSKIDFLVKNTYVEVKSPLMEIPMEGFEGKEFSKFNSFERMIKHFRELSNALHYGYKAVVLLCYMYDAKPFSPPDIDKDNWRMQREAMMATRKGVETWQANLRIGKDGVELEKYFRLKLF
jgi:sugar fermentation stimulation protein A